jgi:hypothetical protein
MTDTIAWGVTGLGNTYAGLLLVGVSDDRVVRGSLRLGHAWLTTRAAMIREGHHAKPIQKDH